jgi:hypothetical protein
MIRLIIAALLASGCALPVDIDPEPAPEPARRIGLVAEPGFDEPARAALDLWASVGVYDVAVIYTAQPGEFAHIAAANGDDCSLRLGACGSTGKTCDGTTIRFAADFSGAPALVAHEIGHVIQNIRAREVGCAVTVESAHFAEFGYLMSRAMTPETAPTALDAAIMDACAE